MFIRKYFDYIRASVIVIKFSRENFFVISLRDYAKNQEINQSLRLSFKDNPSKLNYMG